MKTISKNMCAVRGGYIFIDNFFENAVIYVRNLNANIANSFGGYPRDCRVREKYETVVCIQNVEITEHEQCV